MDRYTLTNNMEVMEYQDSGTPHDLKLRDNNLNYEDKTKAQLDSLLLQLYFKSKSWPDGVFKLMIHNNQLEIDSFNKTSLLDVSFATPDMAYEFIHKNQDMIDEVNNLLRKVGI